MDVPEGCQSNRSRRDSCDSSESAFKRARRRRLCELEARDQKSDSEEGELEDDEEVDGMQHPTTMPPAQYYPTYHLRFREEFRASPPRSPLLRIGCDFRPPPPPPPQVDISPRPPPPPISEEAEEGEEVEEGEAAEVETVVKPQVASDTVSIPKKRKTPKPQPPAEPRRHWVAPPVSNRRSSLDRRAPQPRRRVETEKVPRSSSKSSEVSLTRPRRKAPTKGSTQIQMQPQVRPELIKKVGEEELLPPLPPPPPPPQPEPPVVKRKRLGSTEEREAIKVKDVVLERECFKKQKRDDEPKVDDDRRSKEKEKKKEKEKEKEKEKVKVKEKEVIKEEESATTALCIKVVQEASPPIPRKIVPRAVSESEQEGQQRPIRAGRRPKQETLMFETTVADTPPTTPAPTPAPEEGEEIEEVEAPSETPKPPPKLTSRVQLADLLLAPHGDEEADHEQNLLPPNDITFRLASLAMEFPPSLADTKSAPPLLAIPVPGETPAWLDDPRPCKPKDIELMEEIVPQEVCGPPDSPRISPKLETLNSATSCITPATVQSVSQNSIKSRDPSSVLLKVEEKEIVPKVNSIDLSCEPKEKLVVSAPTRRKRPARAPGEKGNRRKTPGKLSLTLSIPPPLTTEERIVLGKPPIVTPPVSRPPTPKVQESEPSTAPPSAPTLTPTPTPNVTLRPRIRRQAKPLSSVQNTSARISSEIGAGKVHPPQPTPPQASLHSIPLLNLNSIPTPPQPPISHSSAPRITSGRWEHDYPLVLCWRSAVKCIISPRISNVRVSNLPFSFAASMLDRDWPAFEYSSQSMVEQTMGDSETVSAAVVPTIAAPVPNKQEIDELLARQAATILSLWPEAADLEEPLSSERLSAANDVEGQGRVLVESGIYFNDEEYGSDQSAEEDITNMSSLSNLLARRAELNQILDECELGSTGEEAESEDCPMVVHDENSVSSNDLLDESVERCWAGWGVLWEDVEPPPTKKRRLTAETPLILV